MKRYAPPVPLHVDRALSVSSLGLDSATTAAAMRAGLSRPAPLYGFAEMDESGEESQIRGHPIGLLTRGFESVGRYRQLLGALFARLHEPLGREKKIGTPLYLLVGVPDAERYREGTVLASGEPLGEDDDDFDLGGQSWEDVVSSSLEAAGLAERFAVTRVVEAGPARSTRLLQLASRALEREPDATVVVAIVDTLADTAGLNWLSVTGRLKSAAYPVGVSPGEGAGALFLSRRASSASLRVESIGYAKESHDLFADAQPEGRALAELLDAFADEGEPGPLWSIANLSGEPAPFFEWGMAGVHRRARAADPERVADDPPWLPAMHVGETGAAFLPLALAWATEACARGYAPAARCAIVIVEHGVRRALVALSQKG